MSHKIHINHTLNKLLSTLCFEVTEGVNKCSFLKKAYSTVCQNSCMNKLGNNSKMSKM